MSAPVAWDIERARRLNAKLSLDEIFVWALEAGHTPDAVVSKPRWTFSMNLEPVHWLRAESTLLAIFPITVAVQHDAGEGREDLGHLRVALRLGYKTSPDFADEDEAFVGDYLGTAGWLHAWPYLRTEIQSLSSRLGFPPLVLPVLLAGQTATVPCQRIGNVASKPSRKRSAGRTKKSPSPAKGTPSPAKGAKR